MTDAHPQEASILISANLSPAEAVDQQARILALVRQDASRSPVIDFVEAQDCTYPTAVSLQLCLATAAELSAQGRPPSYGPEAKRLLALQNLV